VFGKLVIYDIDSEDSRFDEKMVNGSVISKINEEEVSPSNMASLLDFVSAFRAGEITTKLSIEVSSKILPMSQPDPINTPSEVMLERTSDVGNMSDENAIYREFPAVHGLREKYPSLPPLPVFLLLHFLRGVQGKVGEAGEIVRGVVEDLEGAKKALEEEYQSNISARNGESPFPVVSSDPEEEEDVGGEEDEDVVMVGEGFPSFHLPPKMSEYSVEISTRHLGMTVENVMERAVVRVVRSHSEAESAGVKRDSLLVRIGDRTTSDLSHLETLEMLRNAPRPIPLRFRPLSSQKLKTRRAEMRALVQPHKAIPDKEARLEMLRWVEQRTIYALRIMVANEGIELMKAMEQAGEVERGARLSEDSSVSSSNDGEGEGKRENEEEEEDGIDGIKKKEAYTPPIHTLRPPQSAIESGEWGGLPTNAVWGCDGVNEGTNLLLSGWTSTICRILPDGGFTHLDISTGRLHVSRASTPRGFLFDRLLNLLDRVTASFKRFSEVNSPFVVQLGAVGEVFTELHHILRGIGDDGSSTLPRLLQLEFRDLVCMLLQLDSENLLIPNGGHGSPMLLLQLIFEVMTHEEIDTLAIPLCCSLASTSCISARISACSVIPFIYTSFPIHFQLQLRGLLNRGISDPSVMVRESSIIVAKQLVDKVEADALPWLLLLCEV